MIFPHCFPQSLGLFWPALPLTPCRPHPDTHFALRDNFGLMSATGGVVKGPFWHADPGFKQTCKQKQTQQTYPKDWEVPRNSGDYIIIG